MINANNNYEKGPLFSLLTVASNHQLSNNQTFLTIPGDTIFDEELLKAVLSIINTHFQSKSNIPAVFYQEIEENYIQKLDGSKQGVKIINTVKINESGVFFEILDKFSEIPIETPLKDKNLKLLLESLAQQ